MRIIYASAFGGGGGKFAPCLCGVWIPMKFGFLIEMKWMATVWPWVRIWLGTEW